MRTLLFCLLATSITAATNVPPTKEGDTQVTLLEHRINQLEEALKSVTSRVKTLEAGGHGGQQQHESSQSTDGLNHGDGADQFDNLSPQTSRSATGSGIWDANTRIDAVSISTCVVNASCNAYIAKDLYVEGEVYVNGVSLSNIISPPTSTPTLSPKCYKVGATTGTLTSSDSPLSGTVDFYSGGLLSNSAVLFSSTGLGDYQETSVICTENFPDSVVLRTDIGNGWWFTAVEFSKCDDSICGASSGYLISDPACLSPDSLSPSCGIDISSLTPTSSPLLQYPDCLTSGSGLTNFCMELSVTEPTETLKCFSITAVTASFTNADSSDTVVADFYVAGTVASSRVLFTQAIAGSTKATNVVCTWQEYPESIVFMKDGGDGWWYSSIHFSQCGADPTCSSASVSSYSIASPECSSRSSATALCGMDGVSVYPACLTNGAPINACIELYTGILPLGSSKCFQVKSVTATSASAGTSATVTVDFHVGGEPSKSRILLAGTAISDSEETSVACDSAYPDSLLVWTNSGDGVGWSSLTYLCCGNDPACSSPTSQTVLGPGWLDGGSATLSYPGCLTSGGPPCIEYSSLPSCG